MRPIFSKKQSIFSFLMCATETYQPLYWLWRNKGRRRSNMAGKIYDRFSTTLSVVPSECELAHVRPGKFDFHEPHFSCPLPTREGDTYEQYNKRSKIDYSVTLSSSLEKFLLFDIKIKKKWVWPAKVVNCQGLLRSDVI